MRGLADDESKERYLKELEQSVEIYGAIVKTGNDVLDTILTEKEPFLSGKGHQDQLYRGRQQTGIC